MHEVTAVTIGEFVDDCVCASTEPIAQFSNPPRGETLVDDLAQLDVLGRIEADHQLRSTGTLATAHDAVIDERVRGVAKCGCIA